VRIISSNPVCTGLTNGIALTIQSYWTQKANFGGTARNFATGFTIGNKGYIGTGDAGGDSNDFWEYDPNTDIWTQKANLVELHAMLQLVFSIGSKGYIGIGYSWRRLQ